MINLKRFRFQPNFNTIFSKVGRAASGEVSSPGRPPLPYLDFFKSTPNKIFILVLIALFILVLFLLYRIVSISTQNSGNTGIDNRAQLPEAKATQTINKEFAFPLMDQEGKEVSKLKINLEGVELRDQIIVKAQRVTAISGRTFLVLNIKITNEYDKTVQMNTRDYFRLSVNNNNEELLAPEIHNDPVEAQASSIKYTKLAFAINDSDKNLKLRVGEPTNPNKTIIDLKL